MNENAAPFSTERNRRMAACLPCQKQKVRCITEPGRTSCRRCLKREVRCISKKDASNSSQSSIFRAAVISDLRNIHTAVSELKAANAQPSLPPLRSILVAINAEAPEAVTASEQQLEETNDLDDEMLDGPSALASRSESPSHVPITSLYQITRLRSLRSKRLPVFSNGNDDAHGQRPSDLISRGALSSADAKRLIDAYLSKTDYYLYGVASKFKDLDSIRNASSLLLVAICTVSALHNPSGQSLYQVCKAELRRLVSNFVFTSAVNLEDFRGLCIACFWLSDIAWPVSGLAIRRAVEFDLQKSYSIVVGQDSSARDSSSIVTRGEAIECLRLWYLLCICDQHLSILYGRPSIIEAQDSAHDWESYLREVQDENSQSENTDIRIVSQIAMLTLLNKVTKLFGTNLELRIPSIFKPQLDQFIHQLDQWVATWLNRCQPHPVVGEYPSKAVMLHFHFSKLFVCSHVFRGLASDARHDPMAEDFKDIALMAVSSAKSIITLITQDPDLNPAFAGLPHYFHTMIAFACSFLLKITTKYRCHIDTEAQPIFDMITRVVRLCRTTVSTPNHLLHWMGEGLQSLLTTCIAATASYEREQGQRRVEESRRLEQQAGVAGAQRSSPSAHIPLSSGASSSQNDLSNPPLDSVQGLGNVWDTAREAAMVFPGERYDEISFQTLNPPFQGGGGAAQAGLGPDGTASAWDATLAFFDVEHMGFGLL
ncbi:hypothetical protein O988_00356 [Pseudogymnoascus sp. VKM F-3808]|nr:hypothetical protein O988_00356 [Pseudogymnoascus sp. VKM F-3808]